jgi:hypothetical protein
MKRSIFSLLALLVLCAAPTFAAGDDVPAWLKESATMSAPVYARDVHYVTLRNDQEVRVDSTGRMTVTQTSVVRILAREGRGAADARVYYQTGTEKVKELRAWLIRSDGKAKKYDGDKVFDVISNPDDIYNETRYRWINAEDDADVGDVFGYQSVTEAIPLFYQDRFYFQDLAPALFSRYTLVLPTGWQAISVTYNHAPVEPIVNGTTYAWQLQNLSPIPIEPGSPTFSSLVPQLKVSFAASSGSGGVSRSFASWGEVSKWASDLHDPQAAVDDRIAAKVQELTVNAKSDLEKIEAIARFAQKIQYISIQTNVGYGNGYRPHLASQILAKAYGDCKDKANLMRTMLKVVRITSYPVAIYSGDPAFVRESWPSPYQFNHCIIAIKVGDEIRLPTVINHPNLGRLLIFDPTDDDTPLGDLPAHEQGSLALIAAGELGSLERMPVLSPESSNSDREVELTLTGEGSLIASVRERSLGQSAIYARKVFKALSAPQYSKLVEGWISNTVTGAKFAKIAPVDNQGEGRFSLDVEFSAPSYAQNMAGRLLVFNPSIINRTDYLAFTAAKRLSPIVIRSGSFTETVRVKIPVGFDVDEMPEPVKLNVDFGSYVTTYEVKDGQLVFTRKLTQRAATIPADQYEKVRTFFAQIRAAEQASVVLAKK